MGSYVAQLPARSPIIGATYDHRCHHPLALMLKVISILLFLIILTVPIILVTLILTHIILIKPMYSIYHRGRS